MDRKLPEQDNPETGSGLVEVRGCRNGRVAAPGDRAFLGIGMFWN
jgi:hypothetical protein